MLLFVLIFQLVCPDHVWYGWGQINMRAMAQTHVRSGQRFRLRIFKCNVNNDGFGKQLRDLTMLLRMFQR
jgi:hypothetical protein